MIDLVIPWIPLTLAAGVALAVYYARHATNISWTVFWSAIATVLVPAFVLITYLLISYILDRRAYRMASSSSSDEEDPPAKTPPKTPPTPAKTPAKTPVTPPKTPPKTPATQPKTS